MIDHPFHSKDLAGSTPSGCIIGIHGVEMGSVYTYRLESGYAMPRYAVRDRVGVLLGTVWRNWQQQDQWLARLPEMSRGHHGPFTSRETAAEWLRMQG